MVKVKCKKHGEHLIKPTDLVVLLEQYVAVAVDAAFNQPLPVVEGVSTPEVLRDLFCPQKDLDDLKTGRAKRV